MTNCPQCAAKSPGERCIYCGFELPLGIPSINTPGPFTPLGCLGTSLCILGLLIWNSVPPGVAQRNQKDHPALVQAREMIRKQHYSEALDSLHRAPSRSAYTADLRGIAMLGMNGGRPSHGAELSPLLRAQEAFQEAVALDPEVGPAQLHLAACQAVLGEKKEVVLATLTTCEKLRLEEDSRQTVGEIRGLVNEGQTFTLSITPISTPDSQTCVLLPVGH